MGEGRQSLDRGSAKSLPQRSEYSGLYPTTARRKPEVDHSSYRQNQICQPDRLLEADDDDEDAEEMDEVVRTTTRQRIHKTQTVNRAYPTQTGSVFSNL
jgi:hypothetical protein